MAARITSFEQYKKDYDRSVADPEGFWAEIASEFTWKKKWDKVLEWDFVKPDVKWFIGGKLNITENCLDRYLQKKGDKIAIIWEANNPTEENRNITYSELHSQVCQFANVLKNQGV